jgi:hypothetical protein
MPLIFDRFPTLERAQAFVTAVGVKFGQSGWAYPDEVVASEDRYEDGIPKCGYPFAMDPFIAVIERVRLEDRELQEQRVIEFVDEFGGEFIGT